MTPCNDAGNGDRFGDEIAGACVRLLTIVSASEGKSALTLNVIVTSTIDRMRAIQTGSLCLGATVLIMRYAQTMVHHGYRTPPTPQ
jgi:hypothetical protein